MANVMYHLVCTEEIIGVPDKADLDNFWYSWDKKQSAKDTIIKKMWKLFQKTLTDDDAKKYTLERFSKFYWIENLFDDYDNAFMDLYFCQIKLKGAKIERDINEQLPI